ncbi:hypothetical protein EJB05_29518, partial [Eragrostis curvula]
MMIGNMDKRLPKHVLFKGDNGNYMAAVTPPGTENVYLQFYVSPEDKLMARCRHTIEYTNDSDGSIRIKSDYYGMYWKLSPNWIWVDSSDITSSNRDTLFRPVKIGEGTYALQNLGNGNYCHRLTADYKQSCLNASSPSIGREAYLTVEEAVLSRRIFDIQYRTKEAKIHNEKVITLTSREAINSTTTADKMTLGLKYTIAKERKWDSSVSMKFGVKTTLQAGIPEVASVGIEIETEFSSTYDWGQSIQDTVEDSTDYEVTVPPSTKVKVSVVATQATCDIPFSYTQEDVLTTGETVKTTFNDGIYRGVNSYNVKIEHSLL